MPVDVLLCSTSCQHVVVARRIRGTGATPVPGVSTFEGFILSESAPAVILSPLLRAKDPCSSFFKGRRKLPRSFGPKELGLRACPERREGMTVDYLRLYGTT